MRRRFIFSLQQWNAWGYMILLKEMHVSSPPLSPKDVEVATVKGCLTGFEL